jgi:hypothetical protein
MAWGNVYNEVLTATESTGDSHGGPFQQYSSERCSTLEFSRSKLRILDTTDFEIDIESFAGRLSGVDTPSLFDSKGCEVLKPR